MRLIILQACNNESLYNSEVCFMVLAATLAKIRVSYDMMPCLLVNFNKFFSSPTAFIFCVHVVQEMCTL